MKSVFWSFLIFAAIMLAYWIDLFDFFAQKGALLWALVLVIAVFSAGCRVLGNPLNNRQAKDDDNEDI